MCNAHGQRFYYRSSLSFWSRPQFFWRKGTHILKESDNPRKVRPNAFEELLYRDYQALFAVKGLLKLNRQFDGQHRVPRELGERDWTIEKLLKKLNNYCLIKLKVWICDWRSESFKRLSREARVPRTTPGIAGGKSKSNLISKIDKFYILLIVVAIRSQLLEPNESAVRRNGNINQSSEQ